MNRNYLLEQATTLLKEHIPNHVRYIDDSKQDQIPYFSKDSDNLIVGTPKNIFYEVADNNYELRLDDHVLTFTCFDNHMIIRFDVNINLSERELAYFMLDFDSASKRYLEKINDEIKVPTTICDTLESSLMIGCIPDGEK